MDDRTLIERAAKAAGIELNGWTSISGREEAVIGFDAYCVETWNPLTDDGDIARLEADCEIEIEWCKFCVIAKKQMPNVLQDVHVRVLHDDHNGDKQKARRYASTRAAASLAMGE